MKILVLDPSGNFDEGKGVTGWALFTAHMWSDEERSQANSFELEDIGDIRAKDFTSPTEYWHGVTKKVMSIYATDLNMRLVVESYKLQANKAMAQSWSVLETSQLIGVLRYLCFQFEIDIRFQDPVCKIRFPDAILVKWGIVEKKGNLFFYKDRKTNDHMRDAIRHGLYYNRYFKGESK